MQEGAFGVHGMWKRVSAFGVPLHLGGARLLPGASGQSRSPKTGQFSTLGLPHEHAQRRFTTIAVLCWLEGMRGWPIRHWADTTHQEVRG